MDQVQNVRIPKLCADDDMLCKGLAIGGAFVGATVILGTLVTAIATGIFAVKNANKQVEKAEGNLRTTMLYGGGALALVVILGLISTFLHQRQPVSA